MKSSVPSTAKIAKDAKECVQECVSEFISFITSEAAEKCQLEKRKTIGGEDILYAMSNLGFENYSETLKIHLAKLRQVSVLCFQRLCAWWMRADGAGPAPGQSWAQPQVWRAQRCAARRIDVSLSLVLLCNCRLVMLIPFHCHVCHVVPCRHPERIHVQSTSHSTGGSSRSSRLER